MANLIDMIKQFEFIVEYGRAHFIDVLYVIALAWIIHLFNWSLNYRLNIFGIWPRKVFGLCGVIASPWLHGSFAHLISNSLIFLALAPCVMAYSGLNIWIAVTLVIAIQTGLLLWLFGRNAIHVGASAVVLGYLGYLLAAAFFDPTLVTIVIAIACLMVWGGLLLNLLPQGENVSWEGHVIGFASGISTAYLFVNRDLDWLILKIFGGH